MNSPEHAIEQHRRSSSIGGETTLLSVMTAVADAIDYGVAVISERAELLFCNAAARLELRTGQALAGKDGRIAACHPPRAKELERAIQTAVNRGLRSLVTLGEEATPLWVAVLPLEPSLKEGSAAAMLLFGRRHVYAALSTDGYARRHRLTCAETAVLRLLTEGHAPRSIATRQGVAVSTVRTQIQSIRDKTGTRCITDIVSRVASLPPVAVALRT